MSDLRPSTDSFSISARVRSFGYALSGIGFLLRSQHNAWIHAAATLAVIAVSVFLNISAADWRWVVAAIFMVWAAEAFNTAVERICDLVSPSPSIIVKHAKDVAAGAVLFTAISAACIGMLTLWPYLHSR